MTGRATIELVRWTVSDCDPGAGSWDADETGAMTVSAPADTYQALIDAGRLAHPYQGRAEADAAWVRDREWWWRTTFEAPHHSADERIELVFDGLDTFASIYLDGELIGATDNMFRRYAFDVTDRLTPGAAHRLAVRFDPPARAVRPTELPVWSAFTDRVSRSKRNHMRKAQFGWGWDWGPDLPTVGVWRPVRLEVLPPTTITDVRFTTLDLAETARARVEVSLQGPGEGLTLDVRLADPDGLLIFEQTCPAASETIDIEIAEPRPWWTADLGEQPLYTLSVRLRGRDQALDRQTLRVGLRTIELDQSPDPDEPGATFFRFVLNGVPIFAKGACWAPSTSFVADVDEAAYRRLIRQTADANMNMIRVWGGGIYEPDLFHDLCDELGVLVWQDFMFACAHYPDHPEFAASVRAEVEDQVRRLRHHPSTALWCGNNENQAIHRINCDINGKESPLGGALLYDKLIPEVLAALDPTTPYWPGSPWGGPNPNSMLAGDVHDWTVWHGVPPIPEDVMTEPFGWTPEKIVYTRYAEDMARFVSEFGIQAAPAMATLERWMDAGDLDPESQGFLDRIKDEARKADAMMAPVTGAPTSLREYVDFTQWTQAEGLKFGIEHFRRRRPHCSGALLWQLNDCWPCVSWSVIDYDGVEKAAYHAVRRAFAPVLASFEERPEGQVVLWVTNDRAEALEGEAIVSLETFEGRIIERHSLAWSAPAGGHARPWSGAVPGKGQVLRVLSPDGLFEANRLLPGAIKDLGFAPDSAPTASITRLAPDRLSVDITASTYAPFTHLESARADIRFSDNHFDLAAGETRTVLVSAAAAPIGPDDLTLRSWTSAR